MHLEKMDAKRKNICVRVRAVAPPPHEHPYLSQMFDRIMGQTKANEICTKAPDKSISFRPQGRGQRHCSKKPKKVKMQPKASAITLQALAMLVSQSSSSVSALSQLTQPLPPTSARHGPI
mmetsp:Transcript_9744/g.20981  ORF Transcript_9744/g.20981 Transcript_9744/m.20981 type:complete len:120 (-) Transcript_9744:156-515(-)